MSTRANPGSGKRRLAEVEKRYEAPIADVLQAMRDQGYTAARARKELQVSSNTFAVWVQRHLGLPRWPRQMTPAIQAYQRRRSKRIFVRGKWMTIAEAAKKYRLDRRTIWTRILRGVEGDALVAPADQSNRPKEVYELGLSESEWQHVVEYAEARGILAAKAKFGIPGAAIGYAVRGEDHRLA